MRLSGRLLMFVRTEGQLQEGTITGPYAHARLAPGEVQTGKLSDEKFDISMEFKIVS